MIYKNEALNEISFPLGGIGTGSIGLAGNGSLVDWEIYNRPNKGSINNYTHMAVKVKKDGKNYCKVLQGDIKKDLLGRYTGANNGLGFGVQEGFMAGFPHFKECVFKGEFPIASIDFADENFISPQEVKRILYDDFFAYMEEKGYTLAGDAIGVKIGFSKEDGKEMQYVVLGMPVDKKMN